MLARPFLDALSNKVNEDMKHKRQRKVKEVDLCKTYAINAHYTRDLLTHKFTVVPRQFIEHPVLAKNNMHVPGNIGLMHFGGYWRNFDFLVSRNRGADGIEYGITSNIIVLDTRIMDTLKRYGYQHLIDEYVGLFKPSLHDYLHGATITTFLSPITRLYVNDSPLMKSQQAGNKDVNPPPLLDIGKAA